MLVLVGLILVGKLLKEDTGNEIVKGQGKRNEEVYTLKSTTPVPAFQNEKRGVQPTAKQVNATDKTYTYRLN